jgi:type I restriction enzyme S subunit
MAEVERARAAVQAQLDAAQTLPAALLRAIFTSPAAQHWPRHRLSELTMKIGSGYTPLGGQASYCTSGIPLIRSQNVLMNSFSTDGLAFIDEDQDNQMESSRVQSKDVLLNITGASIGRVCVVPDEICPANVNQHVSIIRLSEKMSVRFVAFYLSNPEFQKFIMGAQAGATRQALTKQQIENFDIPGPEVEMQEQIAGRLDAELTAARALAETLETRLAEIELLPATLLRDAFTQRTPTN